LKESSVACEQWRVKLDPYLDGELTPDEGMTLGTHLRECTECAAAVLERVQIKRQMQNAGKRYVPDTKLRTSITKTLAAGSRGRTRGRTMTRWRFALIPALVLLVAAFLLSASVGRERAARQRIYSELADLHVATLASATPVDVVSTDRHTVKPWFQGRIPFTFNLPELSGTEFSLVGGRVAYLEQTPGAHLIYQIRKHEISVFIFPEREAEMRGLPSGSASAVSFNAQTWTQDSLRYFVIGDAASADILELSKLLRDAG
jgi:anti-sigma factor RsiW